MSVSVMQEPGVGTKLMDAQTLALRLMREFGIHEQYVFRFNGRKRSTGLCRMPWNGQPGSIELSAHFVVANPVTQVEETIRHEIAHALAGVKAGHGQEWKDACRVTGANPERECIAEMPMGKWQCECPSCGKKYHRHRRPKTLGGIYCRQCGPDRGSMTWHRQ